MAYYGAFSFNSFMTKFIVPVVLYVTAHNTIMHININIFAFVVCFIFLWLTVIYTAAVIYRVIPLQPIPENIFSNNHPNALPVHGFQ